MWDAGMEEGWVGKAGSSLGEQRGGVRMEQLAWQRKTAGLERAEKGLETSRIAQPRQQRTLDLFRPS